MAQSCHSSQCAVSLTRIAAHQRADSFNQRPLLLYAFTGATEPPRRTKSGKPAAFASASQADMSRPDTRRRLPKRLVSDLLVRSRGQCHRGPPGHERVAGVVRAARSALIQHGGRAEGHGAPLRRRSTMRFARSAVSFLRVESKQSVRHRRAEWGTTHTPSPGASRRPLPHSGRVYARPYLSSQMVARAHWAGRRSVLDCYNCPAPAHIPTRQTVESPYILPPCARFFASGRSA